MTKSEEEMRAEFEGWWSNAVLPATPNHEGYTKQALEWTWQARQPEIDAKNTEIARLREALLSIQEVIDHMSQANHIATKALEGRDVD